MKRLLVLVLAVFGSCAANCQTLGVLQKYCDQGGVPAKTQGLNSTNTLQGIIPSCTVSVYLSGTQVLATIYSNSTGTPLANPFTANSLGSVTPGQFTFWAPPNLSFYIVLSGGVAPNVYSTPVTLLNVSTSFGGAGDASLPVNSVQFALNTNGQFGSDPNITINATNHSLNVAGTGTGQVGICGATSTFCVYMTVDPSTQQWIYVWPTALPSYTGTNCISAPQGSGISAWLPCVAVSGIVNAALDPTAGDIALKINHAVAYPPCSYQCTVYVPAGNYATTNSISIPLLTYGTYGLTLDPGASITYTGGGDAIVTPVGTQAITGSNHLVIQGGTVTGVGAANGVHLYPGNGIAVRDMVLKGFTNGILVEGSDVVNIYNNDLTGNQNGIQLISTACINGSSSMVPASCSPSLTGSVYSPNAIHVHHNLIDFNEAKGIWDNGVLAPGSSSLGNTFSENDLEQNAGIAVLIGKAVGDVVEKNYFEGTPREVVLGSYTGSPGDYSGCTGCVVRDNYFTTVPATPYNIELENTRDALIEGNNENSGGGNTASSNCFINAATNGERGTVIGANAILQSTASNTGNPICVGGVPNAGPLVGAGSYQILNSTFQMIIANSNYAITSAGTSETAPASPINAGSTCLVGPTNSAAAVTAQSSYYIPSGTNTGTLYHPSGAAGQRLNIFCTPSS